jgi:hypothetical protein
LDLDEPALKGRNKVAQYVEAARARFPHVLSHKCWVQKEGKLSVRRRLARSEAERTKKWFLMPVAPNTKLALSNQNVMHSDLHFYKAAERRKDR